MASSVFRPRTTSLLTGQNKENEDIKLEEHTLNMEFKWLLESEFSHKLLAIQKCLEECNQKLSVVLRSSHGSSGHKILLSHPQQGEPVTCVASVEGDKISKADITLRLPAKLGSTKPLRTSIKEHAAWRLKQIQDSANHFEIAYQKLQTIIDNTDMLSSPLLLSQAFSELCGSLRSAQQVLVVPQLPSVAEIYSAELRSHFKPELPEDTVIHFHINSYKLVLTIFSVAQINRPVNNNNPTSSSFQIGSTFDFGTNCYEVTNQIQVQSPVPWLSTVLDLLQDAQSITQDFIDKVKVFEDVFFG